MAAFLKEDWHHSGSSCCTPIDTCCLSWWCPCIVYGRTHHRLKNNGSMEGHNCCNVACAGYTGLACIGISFIMPMLNRGDMRARYHLKGNACTDCLCACCCTPCDITQQDKESEYREKEGKGLLGQPGKQISMEYLPQQQNMPMKQ